MDMRVVMEVQREGQHYRGSLTRVSDSLCLPFTGLLELVAALERLDPEPPTSDPDEHLGSPRQE